MIRYRFLTTPVAPILLAADDAALRVLEFSPADRPVRPLAAWQQGDNPVLRRAVRQLEEYFAGRRHRFDLPLASSGTPFQETVWAALMDIPWGETRTYGELAASIGRPTASRAVGAANGRNPISIIRPCHRVIGADGSLTGYGGGLPAKRWLLEIEGSLQRVA